MLFFFFQAEDGIRDGHVTGVQTCALPIFLGEALEVGVLDTVDLRGDGQLDAGDPTLADVEGDRRGGVHGGGWEIGRASCRERVWVWEVAGAGKSEKGWWQEG